MVFEQISAHIKNSHWKFPVIIVFAVGLICGLGIFAEDYSTSLLGYQQLQTLKVLPFTAYLVAFVPQIGQIIFGYAAVTDENKRWAGVVAFLLFITDWGLDVYYKSGPKHELGMVVLAGFESFVIYTLLSEVLIVICVGTLMELLGPVFSSLKSWLFPFLGPSKKHQPQQNQFKQNNGGGEKQKQSRIEMDDEELILPRKPRPS